MHHSKARYSVTEALDQLGTSRATFYARIRRGEILTHLDGRRRYVSADALDAYLRLLEAREARPRNREATP